jgi:opacity protein-like surface antigen
MSTRLKFIALALLLFGSRSALAQYYYGSPSDYPVHWYVMGGLSQPVGSNTNDILQSGWDVGFGVAFRQSGSPFALRLELNYASNNASRALLSQGAEQTGLQVTGGWADLWSLTANGEARVPLGVGGAYGYVVAGVGGYYTQLNIQGYGNGYFCYPWWGYCYYGTGPVVASNNTTKFGWNAGVGVGWPLRNGMNMFVEARYNAIQLPQTLEYIPITVGVRF